MDAHCTSAARTALKQAAYLVQHRVAQGHELPGMLRVPRVVLAAQLGQAKGLHGQAVRAAQRQAPLQGSSYRSNQLLCGRLNLRSAQSSHGQQARAMLRWPRRGQGKSMLLSTTGGAARQAVSHQASIVSRPHPDMRQICQAEHSHGDCSGPVVSWHVWQQLRRLHAWPRS